MNKDIFVVVPSYNHAHYVEECLRSIFAQTLTPKKLLVIDDGSKDGSPGVIERVLKDCTFNAELIARENRGLCATLNQAYDLSEGEYFAYLGSDDMWLPEFLDARSALLASHPDAVLGYGHVRIIDGKGNALGSTDDPKVGGDLGRISARELLLRAHAPVSSGVFYRRSALAGLRWNESARLEDYEMYLQLIDRGEFVFDPRVFSVWRDHGYNSGKDAVMMMSEITGAQHRQRSHLDLDDAAFAELQQRTRFHFARMMLQHGQKADAVRTALSSWRGAASASQLLRFIARLAVPMALVRALRR